MRNYQAKSGTLGKVFAFLGQYRVLLILSLLTTVLTVGCELFVPLLAGDAIDTMTGAGAVGFDRLSDLLLLLLAISLGAAVFSWATKALGNFVTNRAVRDLRRLAFEKLQHLPLSYLDTTKQGDTVARIIGDTDRFAEGLLLGFSELLSGVLTIVGTLIFMLSVDFRIAICVVLLTPLSLFVARFLAKKSAPLFRADAEARAKTTAFVDEYVGNAKLVTALGFADGARDRFDSVNEKQRDTSCRATFFSSLVNPTTRFVNSIVYAAVALVGALFAIATAGTETAFTVGMLASLLAYTKQYTKPFNEISGIFTEFQNALASADRIFALLDETPEIPDGENAAVLTRAEGAVSLRDVFFSYSPEKPLIEHLSLDVKRGQNIAIVGPTGCGKTTLINLLMRFYDVTGGAILAEGHDLRDVTRASLREQYGMVLQDTWIRRGTVAENIAIGKPDATREEIEAAAKAAHAHGFIRRMEGGYDAVLPEGGDGLSSGQKQLLAIARVMLALPPMLILDEATSSIDTRTEAKIRDAFDRLTEGRTSFIVAHRLSTIRNADLILVMRDGHVVESGKHAELLEKGGFYAKLYNAQFEQ